MACAFYRLLGGARPIGWQLQQRKRTLQLFAPEPDLFGKHVIFQEAALPNSKVGILDGQFGQGWHTTCTV